MPNLLEDIEGAEPIVDEILVWGQYVVEHGKRLRQVLDQSREANQKLNPQNSLIRKDAVPYVGYLLTKDGLKPDPEKVQFVQFEKCDSHKTQRY